MNLDRMVFAPGDKVMRVGGCRGGANVRRIKYNGAVPQYGVVYCVEDIYEGPLFNVIMLVGFHWHYKRNGQKCGWYAGAFRKVEEIQLCVQAANRAKAKELQPA